MGAGASTPNYRVNYRLMMSILREDDPTLSEDDALQIVDYALRNDIDLNIVIQTRREMAIERRRRLEQQRQEERDEERARIEISQRRRRGEIIDASLRNRIDSQIRDLNEIRRQLLEQIRGVDQGGGSGSVDDSEHEATSGGGAGGGFSGI